MSGTQPVFTSCSSVSFYNGGIYKDDDMKLGNTTIERPYEIKYQIPINGIGGIIFKTPIMVNIVKSFDECIGNIEEFDIFSFGSDDNSVLMDIKEDLSDLIAKLKSTDDAKLGRSALNCKRSLINYGAIK